MWLGVIPVVLTIGTTALVIAEYTEIFRWLSLPVIPILDLLGIAEAERAAQSVVVGFADMFLPQFSQVIFRATKHVLSLPHFQSRS